MNTDLEKFSKVENRMPVTKMIQFELQKMFNFECRKNEFLIDEYQKNKIYDNAIKLKSVYAGVMIEQILNDIYEKGEIDLNEYEKVLNEGKENKSKITKEIKNKIKNKIISKDLFNILFNNKELYNNEDFVDFVKNNNIFKQEEIELFEIFRKEGKVSGLDTYDKNLKYSLSGTDSNSVSSRIIDDNFPIFIENKKILLKIKEANESVYNDIIDAVSKELQEIIRSNKIEIILFDNNTIISKVDVYNKIINGFIVEENGRNIKKQGINEIINQKKQQTKISSLKILDQLMNQILSSNESFFNLMIYKNKNDLCEEVNDIKNNIITDVFLNNVLIFFSDLKNKNYNNIYLNRKAKKFYNHFTCKFFDGYEDFKSKVFEYCINNNKKNKDISKIIQEAEKEVEKKYFTILDFQNLNKGKDIYDFIQDTVKNIIENINIAKTEIISLNDSDIVFKNKVKRLMDAVLVLENFIKVFDLSRNNDYNSDIDFECNINHFTKTLCDIISKYNKIRNTLTKNKIEISKIECYRDSENFKKGFGNFVNNEDNRDNGKDLMHFYYDNAPYCIIQKKPLKKDKIKELFNVKEEDEKVVYITYETQEFNGNLYNNTIKSDDFIKDNKIDELFFDKYNKDAFVVRKYKENKDLISQEDKKNDYINLLIMCIQHHPKYSKFLPTDIKAEDFNSVVNFTTYLTLNAYNDIFAFINKNILLELEKEGIIDIFKITNKDIKKTTNKNIRDRYTQFLYNSLFGNTEIIKVRKYNENMKDYTFEDFKVPVKIQKNVMVRFGKNGKKMFYREPSKNMVIVKHEVGSFFVNKTYRDKYNKLIHIPNNKYMIIYETVNNKNLSYNEKQEILKKNLSEEEFNILPKIVKKCTRERIKDFRYTKEQFSIHFPVLINFDGVLEEKNEKDTINNTVQDILRSTNKLSIIGNDLGERNLISSCEINENGEIINQYILNVINDQDFKTLLDEKEKMRKEKQKEWEHCDPIKVVKDDFCGKITGKIQTDIENNENFTIIGFENLNKGFKGERKFIGTDIYKVTNYIDTKLACMYSKKENKIYKLAAELTNDEKTKRCDKQNGIIFYNDPYLTSKIDPSTGFYNCFYKIKDYTSNNQLKKDFINRFDYIKYIQEVDKEYFEFSCDYNKFNNFINKTTVKLSYIKKWNICTFGDRIVYNKKERKYNTINITQEIKNILNKYNINYKDGVNIIEKIEDNNEIYKVLCSVFSLAIKMRNTDTENDYILSPIKNKNGEFFDTRKEMAKGKNAKLPTCADLNGAYNIAIKTLLKVNKIKNSKENSSENVIITREEYIKYMQTRNI